MAGGEYDKQMNTIYTIGHSNRTIEQFLALLKAHAIEQAVDVRTVPESRHNPQFGQDMLSAALKEAGIKYTHATYNLAPFTPLTASIFPHSTSSTYFTGYV